MVFGEVNAALSLWDRLSKWRQAKKIESIPTRFIRLFETHGVHRNQIPRFFGHGLTLKDLQDDTVLLAKLDETLLEATCALFAVRREWLDGAEAQTHSCHDFYKYPEEFSEFLNKLLANNPEGQMSAVLLAPENTDGNSEALLILQEIIGVVGDKPIYRYHLCNNWSFSYWKSRAYLTACVAIADKRHVFVHGRRMPGGEVEKLSQGNVLVGKQGESIWGLGNEKWYPEDMASIPEVYLEGVDPEQDNFGIKSALQLWLDLDQKGLMDTSYKENARQLFQQKLAKYSPAAIDEKTHIPFSRE